MSSWKECRLGDVANINPTESLRKGTIAKKIPMDALQPFTKKIPKFDVEQYNGGVKFRNGDTLVARITPSLENGKTSFVDILDENEIGFGSTEFIVLREKEDESDKHFLYYFAMSSKFREIAIKSMTGSSGRQRVQNEVVFGHEFLIPPLEEQKAIAEVLSSLDDKIDLLHRQNQTLESLAQTFFRQWFIEEAKEEWEIGTFNDLVEVSSGKSLKRELFDDTGKYEVLGANGKIGKTNEWLFEEKLIYTGRVGTLGKVFLIDEVKKVWLSDNTLIIKPKRYFYFIYFLMIEFNFEEFNVGSTQPLIRQSDLKNIEILLPNDKLILKFEEQAKDIFIKINKNKKQIQTLENLRDTLLPKLLSGEVRVEI